MIEIKGKYTEATIFTGNIEESALSQVYGITNHPTFKNEKVRIMPDVHAGAGCVIGFTSTYSESIIPNLIGVDIGCGMLTATLGKMDINLAALDRYIRQAIPHGSNVNKDVELDIPKDLKNGIKRVCECTLKEDTQYHLKSLGSLGGGNHFIEINKDDEGCLYLVIHSGSRNLGHRIASHYQKEAIKYCELFSKQIQYSIGEYQRKAKVENDENIERMHEANIYKVDKELSFLQGILAKNYLEDMKVAQDFARYNRTCIAKKIIRALGLDSVVMFETVHNYISSDWIIRKGAVDASLGKRILIPINMRDGSLLCRGKGNEDWNCSAPHGAGRIYSRSKAKEVLKLEDFEKEMEGIYTTSVSNSTLDEAPMAYKTMDEIIANTADTMEIIKILKPIYNFKAH